MIALFLLLAAQAAPSAAVQSPRQNCVRAVGSEITVCGTPPQQAQQQAQQAPPTYRLPRLGAKTYGPLPGAQADLGHGVRATLRGQATNAGRARRNKPVATVSVPF
jgi:hypothetical protein